MNKTPSFRRWLSLAGTTAIFAAVLGLLAWQRPSGTLTSEVNAKEKEEKDKKDSSARSWPLFGGTVQRNLVNLVDKDLPTDWSTTPDKEKNIKWSVRLGSKAYGGPIIAGGKIFVGTNNQLPRNKEIKGDKGVIMCFRESD